MDALHAELRRRIAGLAATPEPLAGVIEEPLSEYVVELMGLVESAQAESDAFVADLLAVLADDLAYRLGVLPWPGAAPRVAALVPDLVRANRFTGVLDSARRLLPSGLTPRLAEPAESVAADIDRLVEIHRSEWRDGDTAVVAAGAAELAVRVARVVVAARLVARAAEDGGDLTETAARRYAWRWLRDPAPEAAVPRHRSRTALLLGHVSEAPIAIAGPDAAPGATAETPKDNQYSRRSGGDARNRPAVSRLRPPAEADSHRPGHLKHDLAEL